MFTLDINVNLTALQVAYQRILQLTYVNDLLATLKSLFVKAFEPFLTNFVASLHALNSIKVTAGQVKPWNFTKAFEGWDVIFDKVLKGFEDRAAQVYLLGCNSDAAQTGKGSQTTAENRSAPALSSDDTPLGRSRHRYVLACAEEASLIRSLSPILVVRHHA